MASMKLKALYILVAGLALTACGESVDTAGTSQPVAVDPMAEDFFFMRNPEIREDLLEQLTIHEIEHWINEDNSIGFRVKDTREVDRLANEAIGVYISLQ